VPGRSVTVSRRRTIEAAPSSQPQPHPRFLPPRGRSSRSRPSSDFRFSSVTGETLRSLFLSVVLSPKQGSHKTSLFCLATNNSKEINSYWLVCSSNRTNRGLETLVHYYKSNLQGNRRTPYNTRIERETVNPAIATNTTAEQHKQ